MKKRLALIVGIFILLLPFVSAKAFTWSIVALNHSSIGITSLEPPFWKASLGGEINISSAWAFGWKDDRHCKTSFIQELWLKNELVTILHCHADLGCWNSEGVPGVEWITDGCVQYSKGGAWIGPSKPIPYSSVKADMLVARHCYTECGGYAGGVSGFQYDIPVSHKDLADHVVIDDGAKDLTPDGISAVLPVAGANTVHVSTDTKGIMLWIGSEEDYTQTKTSDVENSHVYVCVDSDGNNICDALEASFISCRGKGGDWYKGICCGYDVACTYAGKIIQPNTVHITRDGNGNILNISYQPITDAYRRVISTPVNLSTLYVSRDAGNNIVAIRDTPATGFVAETTAVIGSHCAIRGGPYGQACQKYIWTIPPLSGDATFILGKEVAIDAYCGNNSEGMWEWAQLEEPGEIHVLSNCPAASLVSNGEAFFSCGNAVDGAQPLNGILGITIGSVTHEYTCINGMIEECAGSKGAFSTRNNIATGASREMSGAVYYCASDGDWTTDLDIKDKESCEAAGFIWTGSLCCSEADDTGEYYNDPAYPNAIGGCWNKQIIPSGEFSVPGRVINYKGRFFGCRVSPADPLLALKDVHMPPPEDWLINNSIAPCGIVLMDAQPGGMPHAKCNPNGEWAFTEEPGGTINKSIKWAGLVSMLGISESGCCAYDQCWNGTRCQPLDSYYRIGDEGYICRMPAS